MELYSLYALASVIFISLISFIGVLTIAINETRLRGFLFIMVGLAAGALLGDAFIHLIPEAFESGTDGTILSLLILSGMLTFFVLEKNS